MELVELVEWLMLHEEEIKEMTQYLMLVDQLKHHQLVVVTEPVKVLVQYLEVMVVQVVVGFIMVAAAVEQLPKDLMEVMVKPAQHTQQAEAEVPQKVVKTGILQVVVVVEMV